MKEQETPQTENSWWQRLTRRVLDWVGRTWNRIQTLSRRLVDGIHARIESLDAVQMQRVLVTCAIPATVALVILALAKLSPIIIVLLAILALSPCCRCGCGSSPCEPPKPSTNPGAGAPQAHLPFTLYPKQNLYGT